MQAADAMDGSEKELLPHWVKEAVLHSQIPQMQELKCAFLLIPSEVLFKTTYRATTYSCQSASSKVWLSTKSLSS